MKRRIAHFSPLMIPGLVALVMGLIFLALGLSFTISDAQFREHSATATATVLQTRPDVKVEFVTREGETVRTVIKERSDSMQVGGSVEILYSLEDPYDARAPKVTRTLTITYCALGLAYFLMGLACVVFLLWKHRQGKLLQESGRRIYVPIEEVKVDRTIRVNRRHPYLLIGRAQVEGQEKQFRYRGFIKDPDAYLGRYLTVYYAPGNPAKYMVQAPEETE